MRLGRGGSVQSAGGPRLKGSQGMAVAKFAEKSAAATCWPGQLGMVKAASGGSTHPGELHKSQCAPVCGASPEAAPEMLAKSVLTLQIPPSWPVRTSWASIDTGAHNADSTARKLNQAAKRVNAESGERECGR